MELSQGFVRCPNEKGRFFSFQTIIDFILILLGHALGLDHHYALLIFPANVLKHAKTEGFFQQRELRKTDTAREVRVGLAAQIAVTKPHSAALRRSTSKDNYRERARCV